MTGYLFNRQIIIADVSRLHKISQSTYFEALNLRNDQSGAKTDA